MHLPMMCLYGNNPVYVSVMNVCTYPFEQYISIACVGMNIYCDNMRVLRVCSYDISILFMY
jgi:hypothetical protein